MGQKRFEFTQEEIDHVNDQLGSALIPPEGAITAVMNWISENMGEELYARIAGQVIAESMMEPDKKKDKTVTLSYDTDYIEIRSEDGTTIKRYALPRPPRTLHYDT